MLFQGVERLRGLMMPKPFWIRDRGRWGEYLVRRHYHRRGYHCLEKNWRYGPGEIDLIMASPAHVVFLEVKTRRANPELRPEDTLSLEQETRVTQLAEVFLKKWPELQVPWTFRLAVVQVSATRSFKIQEITLK